jgi:Fe/S biogenesis protein NfuA
MAQTTENAVDEVVVEITDEARTIVADAIAQETNAEELALWLEVRGIESARFVYDLYFQAKADAGDDDAIYEAGAFSVVVPGPSIGRLRGARLEFSEQDGGGLVMVNPNVPTPQEIAPGVPAEVLAQGLEGPLAVRAIAVLEADVNPSIAGHGGRADLVAIDESAGIAYLALSGGCQGCAMSRMTLSQGIEVTLKDQIPELTEIVDVTDHAVGENPFYAN